MGIAQEAKQFRHDKILALLNKQPLTMGELCTALNAKYHTIRADIIELSSENKVTATDQLRDKAIVFQLGRTRPMPMYYHKASNSTIPITTIMDSYVKNPMESASSRATLDVGRIASELLYMLALSHDAAHPNHQALQSSNPAITALRARLTTDVLHIESILGIAKDMLKDETLWNTAKLDAVAGDTLFDPIRIISQYEAHLQGD